MGHAGTLDPFATGLLVLLVGGATRLARFVEGCEKTYLATARLGVATDTDDLTGAALPGTVVRDVSDAELRDTLGTFAGPQRQRPPAFSAKHVAGERSHRLARRGVEVELPEAHVVIHRIDLIGRDGDLVTFRATVSAGTYLRAIARDLGERLGTGAHLTALRRERVGDFSVVDARQLDAVGPGMMLLAPRRLVSRLPTRELGDADAAHVAHGRAIPAPDTEGGMVSLVQGQRLLAVAEAGDGWLRPRIVLEAT